MTQDRRNRQQRRRQPVVSTNIEAKYFKSPYSRVVQYDGVIGGTGGRRRIHIAVYSELNNLPEAVRYSIDEETKTIRPINEPRPVVFMREIQVEFQLTKEQAIGLREWLDDKIKSLELSEQNEDTTYRVIELDTSERAQDDGDSTSHEE